MGTFSPLEIVPGTDSQTAYNSINENFRQIASTNRADIIRDEDGKQRIILGKFPTGEYGLAISIEGVDVVEALQE